MKGVVAYDTYYGNTKIVAEAIADQLKAEGHEAELRNVREADPVSMQGDFMFVGSPIRMGSVTGRTKRFVKKLDTAVWRDKPIVVFTTTGMMPKEPATDKQKQSFKKWALNAGIKLRDMAKGRGLSPVESYLWVEVKDSKGPLVDDGVDKTKKFTHEVVQLLKT